MSSVTLCFALECRKLDFFRYFVEWPVAIVLDVAVELPLSVQLTSLVEVIHCLYLIQWTARDVETRRSRDLE